MKKEDLNKLFKAIADPTRREIFHVLVLGATALSITQISSQFDMTRQGVTKHINLLHEAGLVNIKTKGRERYCLANPSSLKGVQDWVTFYEKFWSDSLKRLENFLEDDMI